MFGALKLHGPVITSVDENNELNGAQKNPYSWGRKHNMVYIDNPVGAGHLHANSLLPQGSRSATPCRPPRRK